MIFDREEAPQKRLIEKLIGRQRPQSPSPNGYVLPRDRPPEMLARRSHMDDGEVRLREIFETAHVAVWDVDFSKVFDLLHGIRAQGVSDLRAYFRARPDRLAEAVDVVRVRDVSRYAVELFEADCKEAMVGSLAHVLLPATMPIFLEQLVTLWDGRRRYDSETVLRTLKGRQLDVAFTIAFGGARCENTLVSILDLSARKAGDRVAAQLASIVEACEDAIISISLDGCITSWNAGAEMLYGYRAREAIGQPCTILLPPEHPDEELAILEQITRGERVRHYETVRRRKDGSLIDISLTVSPVRAADGQIIGASKIARDISERKRAQEQQKQLLGEMKHRLKNNLATINAIANQTLRKAAPEEFAAFSERLRAIGAAQDLLTTETWNEAPMRSVVDGALKPFRLTYRERLLIDGPDFALPAQQAMLLTLALHELATNALKYGALSNGHGRLRLAWEIAADGARKAVSLHWLEEGGPAVKVPESRGFGSKLIERVVASQGGDARLNFAPNGLNCSIDLPLDHP